MDRDKIELVQRSFAKLYPVAQTVDDVFYVRLYEMDPKLYPLLKAYMVAQNGRFTQILGMLANGLARPEMTSLIADQLGRRHLCYGMKDEHYRALRKALLRTLAQALGEEFTPEVKAAWGAAFDLFANLTKDAASEVSMAYCH